MIQVIDLCKNIQSVYQENRFSLEKWKEYIGDSFLSIQDLCIQDMLDSITEKYSWDEYYLPVLNLVNQNLDQVDQISNLVHLITKNLDSRMIQVFGRSVNVNIILYLGLCNGAGWVTQVDGMTTILLGIEKIIELDWTSQDHLNGLILHELGHVYQAQYGILERKIDSLPDYFLWELFTEGIAMFFEQELVNDQEYYHQDHDGWKDWCDQHFINIVEDFDYDYQTMTKENQRYFGDWVDYFGKGDIGYYLGVKFVRFILNNRNLDEIITYDLDEVKECYQRFLNNSRSEL